MQTEIKPRLEDQGRDSFSIILSYNKNPEGFVLIKKEDILEAQLVLDEVAGRLRKVGIQVIFTRDPDTF